MLGGISVWQLLIILAIIVLIFGTKKLKNMGQDLGGALKGFKKEINEDKKAEEQTEADDVEFSEISEEKITASKAGTVTPKKVKSSTKKAPVKAATKSKSTGTASKKATTTRKTTAKSATKK